LGSFELCRTAESVTSTAEMVLHYLDTHPDLHDAGIRCFTKDVEDHIISIYLEYFAVFSSDPWRGPYVTQLLTALEFFPYPSKALHFLDFSEKKNKISAVTASDLLKEKDEEELARKITVFLNGFPCLSADQAKETMNRLKQQIPKMVFAWAKRVKIPLSENDEAVLNYAEMLAAGEPFVYPVAEGSRSNTVDFGLYALQSAQCIASSGNKEDMAALWELFLIAQSTCSTCQEELIDWATFVLNLRVLDAIQLEAWFPPTLDRLLRLYLAFYLYDSQRLPEAADWISAKLLKRKS
jgi:hypothetical protein